MIGQIILTGEKEEEIPEVSGHGVFFKKIAIPNENCSDFVIGYKISNGLGRSSNGHIDCSVSPYQRDISKVELNKSLIIPGDSKLYIQIKSLLKPDFKGKAILEYDIFVPKAETNSANGMKVFINENDRQNAYRLALSNIAIFFDIKNWEQNDNQTLYYRIRDEKKANPIMPLLNKYLAAYDGWFEFYMTIKEIEKRTGRPHILSYEEHSTLGEVIKDREDALRALQNKFDELQFERFKQSHGLGNVKGLDHD